MLVLRFVIFFNVSKYCIKQREHRIRLLSNINILFHIETSSVIKYIMEINNNIDK